MGSSFKELLARELERIDTLGVSKRNERVIEEFSKDVFPRAIINHKPILLFNSNDYLGLRFNQALHAAAVEASHLYGNSAGAVRFISGTLRIHLELEKALAQFHRREAALLFSSAFSANVSIIQALCKGPSAGSLVHDNVAVISDELNHRSIIDGIRVTGLPTEQKAIFRHGDYDSLREELQKKIGIVRRAIVISDGVFSMLGESASVAEIRKICDSFSDSFEEGIIFILDDSHGVGCFGATGRGSEEIWNAQSNLLVGTLGKAFGCEGGYVVGDRVFIDYLREAAASYIYSNPISPAAAGAALAAINHVDGEIGRELLKKLSSTIELFKKRMLEVGFTPAAHSSHAIQPILIGDSQKTQAFTHALFEEGIAITPINYPVVPRGREEIRVQLNALHTPNDIELFVSKARACAQKLGII